MTVFLSSHLLSEIEQSATSMAIINMGELVVQGKVKELLNSGETSIRLDVQPLEKALSVIGAQTYVRGLKRLDGLLEVNMPLDQVSALNALLVNSGIEVHSLIPRRSLEEYFLSITEGATDIR